MSSLKTVTIDEESSESSYDEEISPNRTVLPGSFWSTTSSYRKPITIGDQMKRKFNFIYGIEDDGARNLRTVSRSKRSYNYRVK